MKQKKDKKPTGGEGGLDEATCLTFSHATPCMCNGGMFLYRNISNLLLHFRSYTRHGRQNNDLPKHFKRSCVKQLKLWQKHPL